MTALIDALTDRVARRSEPTSWSASDTQGMVATAHHAATLAAAEVLAEGGNAVDAAVTAALALGVCEPTGSGLGGQTVMMIHLARTTERPARTFALRGPCRAPRRAASELRGDRPPSRGPEAIAIPTTPALLDYALRRYGTMPLHRVIEPAIELADDGIVLTPLQHALLRRDIGDLRQHQAGRIFLDARAQPWKAQTRLRQPEMAACLRRLSTAGFLDLYRGEIGQMLAGDIRARGGFVDLDDLHDIPWPTEAEPIGCEFGEHRVHTVGSRSGTAVIEVLQVLDALGPSGVDLDEPQHAVTFARLLQRIQQDHFRYEEATARDPGEGISPLDPSYARALVREFETDLEETSHLSVMDAHGNAVASTQSLGRNFGSAEVTRGLGFLHNACLRSFDVSDPRHPHFLRAGALAPTHAAPTLLSRDGRVTACLGSTGSERTPAAIASVLTRLRRQSPFRAVAAPRLHCSATGVLMFEAERFSPPTATALRSAFGRQRTWDSWAFEAGGLQLIVRDENLLHGVADPRRDGWAAGPAQTR